jgi:NADPH2:quinone reductase
VKAVGLWEFGDPSVLSVVEVPVAVPEATGVEVEVAFATVNPTDVLFRSGQQASTMTELRPPFIPGMEFSGRVAKLGRGVTGFSVGQLVMGVVNPRRPAGGAMQQRIIVPADSLISLPSSADLVGAATVPMNGLTALKAVVGLELEPGQKTLVTGGAGALGGYAIQIAKHFGLLVAADAKDEDRQLLKSFGVDQLLPRGTDLATAVSLWAPGGVDGVIDAACLGRAVWDAARDGAICISVRGMPDSPDARVRHLPVSVTQHVADVEALQLVGKLYAEGVLSARVAKVLGLAQTSEAHRMLEEGGLRGRMVIVLAEDHSL